DCDTLIVQLADELPHVVVVTTRPFERAAHLQRVNAHATSPLSTVYSAWRRCATYHSIVRRRPSSNKVREVNPKSAAARLVSSLRRGCPLSLLVSQTTVPLNPVTCAMVATSSFLSVLLYSTCGPPRNGYGQYRMPRVARQSGLATTGGGHQLEEEGAVALPV